jgi:hypothetical protein
MNIKLLNLNAMKRFSKWLDINSVHMSFWNNRCKIRPNTYGDSFLAPRIEQSIKANKLLNYIIKRKSR